jgi:hypothetical protein
VGWGRHADGQTAGGVSNVENTFTGSEVKEFDMPIQLNEESGGKVLVLHISGKLVKADYEHFVPEFERLLGQHGRLRLLFDMSDFHGWEGSAVWEDVKFDVKHFADIERLAMVGNKKWQHGMAMFFKPFTKATTQYFDLANTAAARKWLGEDIARTPVTGDNEQ